MVLQEILQEILWNSSENLIFWRHSTRKR